MDIREGFEITVIAGFVVFYCVVAVLLLGHAFSRVLTQRIHEARSLEDGFLGEKALFSSLSQRGHAPSSGGLK